MPVASGFLEPSELAGEADERLPDPPHRTSLFAGRSRSRPSARGARRRLGGRGAGRSGAVRGPLMPLALGSPPLAFCEAIAARRSRYDSDLRTPHATKR